MPASRGGLVVVDFNAGRAFAVHGAARRTIPSGTAGMARTSRARARPAGGERCLSNCTRDKMRIVRGLTAHLKSCSCDLLQKIKAAALKATAFD